METVIVVGLTVLLFVWVLRPLVAAPPQDSSAAVQRSAEASSMRQAIYTTLDDLQFDYQTGKLSRSDYEVLRRRFEDEALAVLQAVERREGNDRTEARD